MTTYVPLRQRPIVAVRLKADLMAPKGDWIGIDPEENTIFHLTNEEFNALYERRDVASRVPRKVPKKITVIGLPRKEDLFDEISTPTFPTATTRNRTAEGAMTSQAGRFFYLLRRHSDPITAADLTPFIGQDNPKSISAAFAVLRELGLVSSQRVGTKVYWQATDRGCVVFDRLGPVCFTKYNLQVPPDTLPASLAEKLAAAWRDRHNP